MRHLLLIAMIPVLALSAASSAKQPKLSDEAKLSKELDGLTPGKALTCIDLRDAGSTKAIGKTLLFSRSRNFVYRNETRGGCEGHSFDTFITRTHGTRLCRGDVISRADLRTGFESGFCIAGDFVPYRRAKS